MQQATPLTFRYWANPQATSTAVAFKPDSEEGVYVYMHTNIGWLPLGGNPEACILEKAEAFAEKLARNYGLPELHDDEED